MVCCVDRPLAEQPRETQRGKAELLRLFLIDSEVGKDLAGQSRTQATLIGWGHELGKKAVRAQWVEMSC